MMSQADIAIKDTAAWLDQVVITCNFCPFAAKALQDEAIRFVAAKQSKKRMVLEQLLEECQHLDDNAKVETTLLVLPQGFKRFDDYLELLDQCQQLLALEGYEGVYQLASFHPEYCFADCSEDDVANFTNRSPYPILHLLREDSVASAIEYYGGDEKAELIPENNIAFCHDKGVDYMRQLFKAGLSD